VAARIAASVAIASEVVKPPVACAAPGSGLAPARRSTSRRRLRRDRSGDIEASSSVKVHAYDAG
jgi:hypothetical protein